jgi:hypothetical protein
LQLWPARLRGLRDLQGGYEITFSVIGNSTPITSSFTNTD